MVSDEGGRRSFGNWRESDAILAELRGFPTLGLRMDDRWQSTLESLPAPRNFDVPTALASVHFRVGP